MTFRGIAPVERPLIVPVFVTHRGCPHRCAFCDQEAIAGRCAAPEEVPGVVERYLAWSAGGRPVELSFYGGSFTALPEEELAPYLAVGSDLLERGVVGALRCSTRPDAVDAAMATRLKASGFATVELGAQTMSDRLLTAMRRGHPAADTVQAVKVLKDAGLLVVLQFMSGYPGESAEDVAATSRALTEMAPDAIRLYPFTPLAGTPIADAIRRGATSFDPAVAIRHAAMFFLAAQEAGIPTIRIGLPHDHLSDSPYPDNLAQVVVAEALVQKAEAGEREFLLPVAWETSLALVRKSGRWPEETQVTWIP